ncbi:Aste57867_23166 [Aphanomyces stellatus]|uniref:Aste57867_23166 protein n=1 Tax=Aphanomyces stellatus TaxID=120398 RepID=A0A485LNX4_9STRA|nr:hypothetical protein As57867_023095 [Aphanomyces stellatus]VFT99814.1 Aste57867_23166 [Aphanomyces stellatus]
MQHLPHLPPFANMSMTAALTNSPTTTMDSTLTASSTERRFMCHEPGCGKRFNRKFTLKEHMKTHTGARPYACDYDGCSACFSTSGNLSRHKFTHTGEKPFGCTFDMCFKRFCTKEKLARHVKTHSGIRPFTCKIDGCNKRFSTSGNLGRHLKTHRDGDGGCSSSEIATPTAATTPSTWKVEPEEASSSTGSNSSSAASSPAFHLEELSSAAIDEHIISVLRYDAKGPVTAKPPQFRPPVVSLTRSHSDFVQTRHQHPQHPHSTHHHVGGGHHHHHHQPHQPLQIAIPVYTQPTSSGRLQFNMIDSPPSQWQAHLENNFPAKLPPTPEYEPLPFEPAASSTAQPKFGRSVSEGAFFNMWL